MMNRKLPDNTPKLALIGCSDILPNGLENDLTEAGYSCLSFDFSLVKLMENSTEPLDVVIICLIDWDDDRLEACEKLLGGKVFTPDIPLVAVVNEKTMRKIPRQFEFDEIIITPYSRPEMEFRLGRIIYQFRQKVSRNIIEIDDISITLDSYEVRVKDRLLSLTLKEYELLKYLASNRGRVYTRESLLETIWGFDYYGGTRTVDVHIRRLRSKIGDFNEKYIKTVRGVGYTFRAARLPVA
ncbi:MAG: response regulator transcription factor [Dehalococcoides mccartyi]|uniref:winged helix-turn-helix transcriptional regulator n=1 Tax=Dehalococcoides mccartyi TaxID=61435 RepID=UPI0030F6A272